MLRAFTGGRSSRYQRGEAVPRGRQAVEQRAIRWIEARAQRLHPAAHRIEHTPLAAEHCQRRKPCGLGVGWSDLVEERQRNIGLVAESGERTALLLFGSRRDEQREMPLAHFCGACLRSIAFRSSPFRSWNTARCERDATRGW